MPEPASRANAYAGDVVKTGCYAYNNSSADHDRNIYKSEPPGRASVLLRLAVLAQRPELEPSHFRDATCDWTEETQASNSWRSHS